MGKAGTLRSLIVAETTQPHVVQSAQLRTHLLSFEKVHIASVSFSVLIGLKFYLCLLTLSIREGVKKNQLFLGKSPKQRTPPTHRYSLGLT